MELHKLDTETQVFFYEQDFYVLSNFSSFEVEFDCVYYKTAEHAYHCQKFIRDDLNPTHATTIAAMQASRHIRDARSAHDAFKIAQDNKHLQRPDWDDVRVPVMEQILEAKADQHEYVARKLMATGDRELIEDSWRDGFWGWGPNRDGRNELGKCWMRIRERRRAKLIIDSPPSDLFLKTL